MSDLFAWKADYSVGLDEIDQQHLKWLTMINGLHAALREGKGSKVINETLDAIVEYTHLHLSHEESLMQKCNYPGYKEHKQIHDIFTAQMSEMHDRAQAGQTSVSVEVMTKMREWLINHITKVDKQYSSYLS